MSPPIDWLSRLLDMLHVRGRVDLRCLYGAPWRIVQPAAAAGEIPYHVVLSGSAVLESPDGGPRTHLAAGDILLLPGGGAHVLHDGSGAPGAPARNRAVLNLTISENDGTGDRLDMLCGHFVLTARHDRLLREYLPRRLVVRARGPAAAPSTICEPLAGLVSLMRTESADERVGGHAMLNALSTALFALTLRLASDAGQGPSGLLALANHPRLAPAVEAMFHEPGRPWTLPDLARLCGMSRATAARQFEQTLGRSASDLLTDIRMTVAARELKNTSASTAAVAAAVGYQSEAAFQRIFKQRMGVTPARWRREARSSGPRRAADASR
ncbi:cupin domain-containing protein [Nannocystis punicea]|uniref:Cupin domain-containing protein n=1 Tax=Nannocystis punicea TaxID=2995304 RepID=A0ABY7HCG2_9BACT|nr:cupin domain-containing protein [Nannocystis poenicansa]WAS96797.1 cupin domain-containing protein [Nannocystis poenicansa]